MPGRRGSGTLSSPRGLPIAPDDYLYPAPKREFLSFTPARGVRKRLATGAGPLVGGDGQDAAGGYGEVRRFFAMEPLIRARLVLTCVCCTGT